MKFSKWRDTRAILRTLNDDRWHRRAMRMPLSDFLLSYHEEQLDCFASLKGSPKQHEALVNAMQSAAEHQWLLLDRPFVNVYPVMESIIDKVRLDVPWEMVEWPFFVLGFQFAETGSDWKLNSALVTLRNDEGETGDYGPEDRATMRQLGVSVKDMADKGTGIHGFLQFALNGVNKTLYLPISARKAEKSVSETLDRYFNDGDEDPFLVEQSVRLLRLMVFTALVWTDSDVVTPLISQKLMEKMEGKDQSKRDQLLLKAAKQNGWGFDLGKEMQTQKDVSPHWRMPHAAVYHTGKGRTVPKIIFRSGALVNKKHGLEVPTGFHGPESPEELNALKSTSARVPLKPKERWFVLKRDNFTCQICGATASDGAKLEIDHKVPVAKGGLNEFENLWVLCFECNRGKGTAFLGD